MNARTRMSKARWWVGLPALFLLASQHAALAGEATLAERFADPPAEARILKIIHSWPDAPEAQDALIDRLSAQGFGGVVCNVAFDGYLEDEAKWRAFSRAVKAARDAGWALWLYDERGYPSGNAGGIVLGDHPEWEARGLLIAEAETEGAGAVKLESPPGRVRLAAAYPVRDGRIDTGSKLDLSDSLRDGSLDWASPPGRWRVLVITEDRLFEGTHAAGNLWAKIPYINLLMPEPTARFLEVTHRRYAERFGPELGETFVSTFTDEPSLMSLFLRPMPYRVLPWAPNLPGEFRRRRGYDLEPILPGLVTDAGPETPRHRYDFWLTVGELVSENFFGQIQDWCQAHGIRSGGHLLAEEGITGHVPLYGDFFRCVRRLDAPSIDCLTSVPAEVPWHIARLLAGAAELEGKALVMSETSDHSQRYRGPGDDRPVRVVTEAEIRGTLNRLFVGGVNRITSYYSFAELDDEQIRRLNEWAGRCGTLLTGGHQVADVALLYPVESLWTRFVPSRLWANEAQEARRIETTYRNAAEGLFAARRDFTVVDSRALTEAKVEGGELVHGALSWRVVILPGTDTLPLAAWENLARFVRSGGVVVALGERPRNSATEFPSPRVEDLACELFGEPGAGRAPSVQANAAGGAGIVLPAGSEGLLPLVLDGLLEPDVRVSDPRAPIRVTHRRIAGHELYLVINDSAEPWSGTVGVAAVGAAGRWNPADGTVAPIEENGGSIALDLEPFGATILRFAESRRPERLPVTSGALPNLALRDLPGVEPRVGRGEFVRAELRREAMPGDDTGTAWDASAVLTRGQVDTYLFVEFPYEPPADLAAADCLVIESWVPPGQRTPTGLLVIIHEEGGGDFLAETGRSLAAHGRERSYLPLDRFRLAGWSSDADGKLDPARIGAVRVGWGGYFGTEGEAIRLRIAPPRVGMFEDPPSEP